MKRFSGADQSHLHDHSSASSLINSYVSLCVLALLHTPSYSCLRPAAPHLPAPSCCPIQTAMISSSLWLRMGTKPSPKSTVAAASSCLHVCSLSVGPSVQSDQGTSGHPDSPATPPGLCVRRKEGRKEGPAVTQEGGLGEREGGSVRGCLSWSGSTPLEALTIEGLFGQGQGQAQVCVCACVCLFECIYGYKPRSSQEGKENCVLLKLLMAPLKIFSVQCNPLGVC